MFNEFSMMLTRFSVVFIIISLISSVQAKDSGLYSINTGSYVYHLLGNDGQYTERFANQFYSIERKFNDKSDKSFLVGTLKNSYGDRCLALGLRKNWIESNPFIFKGVYGYTGEFFFSSFSHCGDEGIYNSFKKITGVGFAPYIYHAVEYRFTDYFSVESGVIFPAVFVVSLHWDI